MSPLPCPLTPQARRSLAQSDAELSLALTREAAATLKSLQVADKARNDAKRP